MTTAKNISLWQQIEGPVRAFIEKNRKSKTYFEDVMSEAMVYFLEKNKSENAGQCYTYLKYVHLFAEQLCVRKAGKEILFSEYLIEFTNDDGTTGREDAVYDEWQKHATEESFNKKRLRDEIEEASQMADSQTRKAIMHLLKGDCENLGQAAKMAGLKGAAFSKRLAAIGAKLDPNCPRALATRKGI